MRGILPWLLAITLPSVAPGADGVILLHGLCRTSASMNRMAEALAAAGYRVLNVNYPSRTAPITMLAEQAIGPALVDPRLRDCPRIHFVTHSLGGILVRSYFSRHPAGKLGRVVMLGPPNQGSEIVDHLRHWRLFRWLNGPTGDELGTAPNSTPNQLGPVTFQLGIIAGDRSINWINSWMLPGPDDGKVSVARARVAGMRAFLVVHVAHPFLMRNRTVMVETIRFLKTGTFTAAPLT